ncbi:hypothetical protein DFJ74DRAFT_709544 [Hyaloraphidium curvatum]|nr:hypothetical protein DFJ74DRAFT_709544 [Hyaloraphidium curvatum]
MGGRQSKPDDVTVHVNASDPPVPIQFMPDLLDTLSKPASSESYTRDEVEHIVRAKLKEQLEAIREADYKMRELEEDIAAQELARRSEELVKQTRTIRVRMPEAEVLVKERAVVECYKRNPDRPIDCWKEFEDFKEAARKSFRDTLAADP